MKGLPNIKNPKLVLTVVTILVLIPFITKPIHIDDPLFLWVAEKITENPFDFFGFDVNWYGHMVSMAEINKNPPLTSYYIAIIASVFGWNEIALHLAFLVPAIGLILGCYQLARVYDVDPFCVSLSMLCIPAVLVSATTLMVDIFMLALWVWSVVFWIKGIEKNDKLNLFVAGLLISLAAWTKYIAISIIPLLLVYTLQMEKKFSRNSAMLLVPVVITGSFFYIMYLQYGQNFFTNIFGFSVGSKLEEKVSLASNLAAGIVFLGGSILLPVFYLHRLCRKNEMYWLLGLVSLFVLSLLIFGEIGVTNIYKEETVRYGLVVQCAVFFLSGTICIYIIFRRLRLCAQPLYCLLLLWVAGILFFSFFLNWSINSRSLLPLAPALTILLWSQLGSESKSQKETSRIELIPLLPVLLVSVSIAWADHRLAASARDAAIYSARNYINQQNTLWFQGGWGFQYYMQRFGGMRVVLNESILKPGDVLIVPVNGSNIVPVPRDHFEAIQVKEFDTTSWISVLSGRAGAGFYTSMAGALPYVFGRGYTEPYYILRATRQWRVAAPSK